MTPWSRAFSVAALLASASCSGRTLEIESGTELSEAPRRAPGVAVDLEPELPVTAQRAHAREGLVVLASPADPRLARQTVQRFFQAVTRESPEELEQLIGADAWVDTGSQRQPVRGFWRTRFSQLDYGTLAQELAVRDSELETFRPEDLIRLGASRPNFAEVRDDDLVIRAKVRISWKGRTRLLGDELVFLLRPQEGRFVIAEMAEDFRLP